jgi:hypothetical protein
MSYGLNSEAQFLLAALQPPESAKVQMQKQIGHALDWDALFAMADRHAVVAILNQSFGLLDRDAIPQPVLERFHIQSKKIWARNLILKNQLVAVLRMFQEQQIPAIPYKGPVYAEKLYGHIGLRCFDDLDLLIHKEDIFKAKDLLFSSGYLPKKELEHLTPSQETAFLRYQYTYDFISRNPGHQLEVHWEIAARSFSLHLDYDGIWKRCVSTSFEELIVPVFSPEDMVLILCITGAKKLWDRLSRVYDIARSLVLFPELDWSQMIRRASDAGTERILFLGLSLASTLLEAPIPETIKPRLENDIAINEISTGIIDRMFMSGTRPAALIQPEDQFQPMHFQVRERRADQLRYCARVAFTPGVGEWDVISLPASLYFLYYFLRPVRLGYKAASRLVHLLSRRTKKV